MQETDILDCKDGLVTFRYRDARTAKSALRTLPGADFLWLVLQHVLPKGLRRARNFGFLHPNSAGAVRLLQVLHLRPNGPAATVAPTPRPTWRCACGQPMQVLRRRMPAEQADTCAAAPLGSSLNRTDGPLDDHPVVHDRPDKSGPRHAHPMH